jgi:hypothetical protein
LKAQDATLEDDITKLRRQLDQAVVPQDFTEHRGVLSEGV